MSDLYLKETTKDDATHQFNSGFDFKGITLINHSDKSIVLTKDMGTLSKINQPKIVDLSGLVGSTEILFEGAFSTQEDWFSGYLLAIKDQRSLRYSIGNLMNGRIVDSYNFDKIRFASRWYFHDGKSGCPLPEGVRFELQVMDFSGEDSFLKSRDSYRPFYRKSEIWIHLLGKLKVIAYRPTGLIPGYVMPGGE